jgi:cobalt transporter subunit CbtA
LSLTDQFRRLMTVVLGAGTVAGLMAFGIQRVTVVPLIETAETYEGAPHSSAMRHEDEGWQPANGAERTALTALGTVLTGIAFAAVLFGVASVAGARLDTRMGALWGVAGFAAVACAPALGMPPAPPGAAAADLYARQLWWLGTVTATAIGLWLMVGRRQRSWALRSLGALCVAAPHVIGAPVASAPSIVPPDVVHQFSVRAIASGAVFWLVLGTVGGFLSERASDGEHTDFMSSPTALGSGSEHET